MPRRLLQVSLAALPCRLSDWLNSLDGEGAGWAPTGGAWSPFETQNILGHNLPWDLSSCLASFLSSELPLPFPP